jgi:hypothetical protein
MENASPKQSAKTGAIQSSALHHAIERECRFRHFLAAGVVLLRLEK